MVERRLGHLIGIPAQRLGEASRRSNAGRSSFFRVDRRNSSL
jgi:hypothetical protein